MIRQRTSIPLMLDESVFTMQDALEAIRQEAFPTFAKPDG
jgi:muconate cycloisomerase